MRRGEKLTSFWECSFLTRRWMLLDGTSLRSTLRYVEELAVGRSVMIINIAVSLPGHFAFRLCFRAYPGLYRSFTTGTV